MGRLRELYDNFRRTHKFHPKGLLAPVLRDDVSPLEKQAEAFFDEMEKIALSVGKDIALGALLAAAPTAVRAISNEPKERAKDEQAHLTEEQVARSRKRRLIGGVGLTAASALGGGALSYVGSLASKKIDGIMAGLK